MKFTKNHNNQVKNAESKVENEKLIENSEMELTDDVMELVAGGFLQDHDNDLGGITGLHKGFKMR